MDIDAQQEHDAKTGGSIFPVMFDVDGERVCAEGSLMLRDYFAAHSVAAIIAANTDFIEGLDGIRAIAGTAYQLADAMLAARSK